MGFWGKLSDDREQQLSLTDHSIDVASVFRALCDLPAIQRNLGIEASAVTLDRLAVFALLHDLNASHQHQTSRQYLFRVCAIEGLPVAVLQ